MSDTEKVNILRQLLVGKRIIEVTIDPTQFASLPHHHRGSASLTLDSGEIVQFRVGGFDKNYTAIFVNDEEIVRT